MLVGLAFVFTPPCANAGGGETSVPSAEPPPGAPHRWVTLGLRNGSILWPPTKIALLECAPIGGTHPHPREACAVLSKVRGDLSLLKPPPDLICPGNYEPISAWSAGEWDGKLVSGLRVYGNFCELDNILGVVIRF